MIGEIVVSMPDINNGKLILFRLMFSTELWFMKIFHFVLKFQPCQHIRERNARLGIVLVSQLVNDFNSVQQMRDFVNHQSDLTILI